MGGTNGTDENPGGGGGAAGSDAGAGGAPQAGAGSGSALTGDLNRDGCVNLEDYAVIVHGFGCSLATCGEPRADLNGDGWIDTVDYIVFTAHWYEGSTCRAFCGVDVGFGGAAGEGGGGGLAPGSADLNGDGCVDAADLDILAASYGCSTTTCAAPTADIVPDGCVNDADLDAWRQGTVSAPCP